MRCIGKIFGAKSAPEGVLYWLGSGSNGTRTTDQERAEAAPGPRQTTYGHTLLESGIGMAILAILAGSAYPSSHLPVLKGHRTDSPHRLPKFPHVQLRGDIVESLDRWLRQLALAYDWRVEDLDIQPEFVQLVIACAPSDPPETVVQTMMQTTSHPIMTDFPRLAEEHPAGSFWAPGYYVIAPGRLLDAADIARYIASPRRPQGIRQRS